MRLLFFLQIFLFSNVAFGQSLTNVLCYNFTSNGKDFSRGADFKTVLESVLSNIESPPILVERDKLNDLFNQLEVDRNLLYDLDTKTKIAKITAIKPDYLIYGDFKQYDWKGDTIELNIEIVSISDKNFSSKRSFLTRFNKSELMNNSVVFEKKMKEELGKLSFVNGLGVIGTNQLKEFDKRLEEKDVEINYLTNRLSELAQNLGKIEENEKARKLAKKKEEKLKNTPPNIGHSLYLEGDTIMFSFSLLNKVPIKYYLGLKYNNKRYGNFYDDREAYPKKHPFHKYYAILVKDIKRTILSKDKPSEIVLHFHIYSKFYEGKRELEKIIDEVYVYDPKEKTLEKKEGASIKKSRHVH